MFHSFDSEEVEDEAVRLLLMMERQSRILESAAALLESVVADLRHIDWFPGVEEWQVRVMLEHEVKSLDAKVNGEIL